MSSTARAMANVANAQHSTGPKTAAGRAASSRNAVKHGLCSDKILLADEDPAEFQAMQTKLITQHSPDGELETHLVEDMAATIWRIRRIRDYEHRTLCDPATLFASGEGVGVKGFDRLLRYMGMAERQLDRLQKQLKLAQTERAKNEPIQQDAPEVEDNGFVPSEASPAPESPERKPAIIVEFSSNTASSTPPSPSTSGLES